MRKTSGLFLLFLAGAATVAPAGAPAKQSFALASALAQASSGRRLVAWVFFTDKGPQAAALSGATTLLVPLSPRALARRAGRGRVSGATVEDLPLVGAYVDRVTASVDRVRQRSRWLNAVSVEATPAQLEALAKLPFVARLDLVRRYRLGDPERAQKDVTASAAVRAPSAPTSALDLDYG